MKTIRLLTIGNSFSNNAVTFLERIADSVGEARFEVARACLGGCSLEKHWNIAEHTGAHPEYKTYTYCPEPGGETRGANLQDSLSLKEWDVVTLQQVSRKSWQRETFEPYLGNLMKLVRERAPKADVRLHQTWAYRVDSPYLPENNMTQRIMHDRIRANYEHFAKQYGCAILPSGEAVQAARETPGRTFTWPEADYDYQHPEAPALPKQEHSFAVGFQWAINSAPEGIPELRRDPNHLNARGCYLAGAVWYECLTGLDVTATTFAPEGMADDDAAFLRGVAHETTARAQC